ncbi:CLOCK-interacting pacemaker-like isoform X1 [Conger conger]|uniref:CLOCK-interacting pacemaker-like isoform X1 n=1 Tax=Conger conger TaxID=82655 RepID=UPI002A5B036A|nr:CLOCK-interacting pacemaker-like isoform X1 [Conger conger]
MSLHGFIARKVNNEIDDTSHFGVNVRRPSNAGDEVRLRDEAHAGKIRETMNSRVRGHGHQKSSSDTVSRLRMDGPKPESERDSGFSDASSEHWSAHEQTDGEETSRGTYRGAQASQLVMGAPYSGMSPMIFMNNVLLKQQPNDTPPSPKPWGFRPAIEVLPQSQVVFLQPMVSADPSLQRSAPVKRRRSKKYLPILKSYPRIAPHPGDSLSEQGSSSSSERSSSASGQWRRHHGQKQQRCPASVVLLPPPTIPASPSPWAPSPKQCPPLHDTEAEGGRVLAGPLSDRTESTLSASPTDPLSLDVEAQALDPSVWPAEQTEDPAGEDCDSKRKRFCNTYNILSQSGLLNITLRIKELIRQNRHSQGQLEQLQTQAGLFLQAVQSGSPEVWTRLQKSMMEPRPEAMVEEEEN